MRHPCKIFIIFFILFILNAQLVLAHTTRKSENTEVVLHISPDDIPIAGENAVLEFGINDEFDSFNFEQCNCLVNIEKNSESLAVIEVTSSKVDYIFPEPGDYQIIFNAKPIQGIEFNEFTEEFSYTAITKKSWEGTPTQIDNTNSSTRTVTVDNSIFVYVLFGSIIAMLVGIYIKCKKNK